MTSQDQATPISNGESQVNLAAGIDVGGTKVEITDSRRMRFSRFATSDYPDMYAVLDEYFEDLEATPSETPPRHVVLAMAGARNDETGEVQLTNGTWPAFNPLSAAHRYPGTTFHTTNDMVATAAGVLHEPTVDLVQLKPGRTVPTGTRLVVSISTGIGVAAAIWDHLTERYVYLATEGGHIGLHSHTPEEQEYLRYLRKEHPRASVELALSGRFGIEHLTNHLLANFDAPELRTALHRAKRSGNPIGAVLLEFATQGQGTSREVARLILDRMGSLVGSTLRDLAVAYKASGGIYLTGSVSLALGEYFAEHTDCINRFIHRGAAHEAWIEQTPIHLVTNPHVAVLGAVTLAQEY